MAHTKVHTKVKLVSVLEYMITWAAVVTVARATLGPTPLQSPLKTPSFFPIW